MDVDDTCDDCGERHSGPCDKAPAAKLARAQLGREPHIEIPEVAYEAALELLGDLLDAGTLYLDRCPLCEAKDGHGEASPCPIARARLVRDALDWPPVAAAAALEQLRRAR